MLFRSVTESWFSHERICSLTSEHTREVTLALGQLVSAGYLESAGKHKSKVYHLKGIEIPTPENNAGKNISFVASPSEDQLSLFGNEGPDLTPDFELEGPDLTPDNGILFDEQAQQLWKQLKKIAEPIAKVTGRRVREDVEKSIVNLCIAAEPHCLKLADIANLLVMKPDTLRKNYLGKMVKQQQIYLVYPTIPNHPEQGYTTKDSEKYIS